MPDVIQLVAMDNERVGRVAHHVLRRADTCRVGRIQVAVCLLSTGNDVGEFVELCFQFRITSQLKQIGGSLHDLVEVRINEPLGPTIFDFLSSQKITGSLQMLDTRLRALKCKWHQRLPLGHQPRPPEVAGHLDLR